MRDYLQYLTKKEIMYLCEKIKISEIVTFFNQQKPLFTRICNASSPTELDRETASLASFAKPELLFYRSKDMFHFGAYGRLFVFSAFNLSLGTVGVI